MVELKMGYEKILTRLDGTDTRLEKQKSLKQKLTNGLIVL